MLTERKHIVLLGAVAALALPAGASAAKSEKPPPRVRLWGPAPRGHAIGAARAVAGGGSTVAFGLGEAVAVGGPGDAVVAGARLSDLAARYNRRQAVMTARRERHRRARARARREAREAREEEMLARLPGGVSIATLEAIAACESGGDPEAISPGGTYRGKYQFDQGTWESVGGHGDPAQAPEAEQNYRAALLYSESGSSPWPICG